MVQASDKSAATWVLRRLRQAGHEALFAGGCVRDMLLRRRSADYDIATSATPQQVRKLFPRVLLVGAKFGVAMVLHGGSKIEVTTFRSDLSYTDGRRPDGVRFSTPREDAARRDFTINGMFHDPLGDEIIDYVGGRDDLKAGVIRTIGPARQRFAEDYLRMLRAVRFAVRFGFRIDPATASAAVELAGKITSISGERIFDELRKMLGAASAADALRGLADMKLAQQVMPELFAAPALWDAAVKRVESVAKRQSAELAFGAMLVGLPCVEICAMLRRWGASNDLRDRLCWLAERRDGWRGAADAPLCEFKRLMAGRAFDDLRAIWRFQERSATGKLTQSRRISRRASGVAPGSVVPRPFVDGADLQKLGVRSGPGLGRLLRALYDVQLNELVCTRQDAMALARKMLNKGC